MRIAASGLALLFAACAAPPPFAGSPSAGGGEKPWISASTGDSGAWAFTGIPVQMRLERAGDRSPGEGLILLAPPGSGATLVPANEAEFSFIPDIPGTYVVRDTRDAGVSLRVEALEVPRPRLLASALARCPVPRVWSGGIVCLGEDTVSVLRLEGDTLVAGAADATKYEDIQLESDRLFAVRRGHDGSGPELLALSLPGLVPLASRPLERGAGMLSVDGDLVLVATSHIDAFRLENGQFTPLPCAIAPHTFNFAARWYQGGVLVGYDVQGMDWFKSLTAVTPTATAPLSRAPSALAPLVGGRWLLRAGPRMPVWLFDPLHGVVDVTPALGPLPGAVAFGRRIAGSAAEGVLVASFDGESLTPVAGVPFPIVPPEGPPLGNLGLGPAGLAVSLRSADDGPNRVELYELPASP